MMDGLHAPIAIQLMVLQGFTVMAVTTLQTSKSNSRM
jgi:hypothetical protein